MAERSRASGFLDRGWEGREFESRGRQFLRISNFYEFPIFPVSNCQVEAGSHRIFEAGSHRINLKPGPIESTEEMESLEKKEMESLEKEMESQKLDM